MTPLKYAVILKRQADLRPPDIARALAAHRKIPFQDAILAVRKCWGIVEFGAGKAAAEAAAAALEAAGIGAAAIPEQLLEEPPGPLVVPKLEFFDGALGYSGPSGTVCRIDAAKVYLVAAAGFEAATVKQKPAEGPSLAQKAVNTAIFLGTGIPLKLGKGSGEGPRKVVETDRVFFLDILWNGPGGRIRVDARKFDFSGLKEHMAYNSFANLRLVVERTIGLAPGAEKNRGAAVIAEKRPIREMGYESLDDLERELRWLLTLRGLAGPA